MKNEFDIDDLHLKRIPFSVPDSYFDDLQNKIAEEIRTPAKSGFWMLIKPQLSLVASFAIVFLFAYGAIMLITPSSDVDKRQQVAQEDSLKREQRWVGEDEIEDEIIEYLKEDLSSVYVASIE